MKIVTAGPRYLDIDAYACIVAYAELLQLQGEEALPFSGVAPNESVPTTVRSWGGYIESSYSPAQDDEFIIVDASDPEHLDKIVKLSNVSEVIDHRPGNEDFWSEKIGDKADLEFLGAAATMIFERWEKAKLLDRMSQTSARLLVCAILDNTLNFLAKVTTDRDKRAYQALAEIADLPNDWPVQYFSECQQAITNDIAKAVSSDTKLLAFQCFESSKLYVGQIVVWDGREIIAEGVETVRRVMNDFGPDWFVNLVSIKDEKSCFMASNETVEKDLERLLGITFKDEIAVADRMWLRKEIIKKDLES